MRFWKGQALGNDYVVLDTGQAPAPGVVRALCDRHRGVGADGVLVGAPTGEPVGLRIFNPDGTEAEKSGNGLRIFGAWLQARGLTGPGPFQVALPGETVGMEVEAVHPDGSCTVRVDLGIASFHPDDVHYDGPSSDGEVMGARLDVSGDPVAVHLVSLGNPHCVVFTDPLDPGVFRRLAPAIQALPAFRRGVNVQFARVADPHTLEIMIWERGAGETLASGSSASAVVAAALRSGRVRGNRFTVVMPGGSVTVQVDDAWRVRLTGEAQIVFEGVIAEPVVAGWSSTGA
jgi:diaminopimelate epimerase